MSSGWELIATDIQTNEILGNLPFGGMHFSRKINAAGDLSVDIPINDPVLSEAREMTAPNKTALWVFYNGTPVWGGISLNHRYTMTSGHLEITANTWSAYFGHRWQAKDYSYTWMAPADPMTIASTVVGDAMSLPYSVLNLNGLNDPNVGIPFAIQRVGHPFPYTYPAEYVPTGQNPIPAGSVVVYDNETPYPNWITASYPSIQMQQVSMIISTITEMGYGVGFDYRDSVIPDPYVPSHLGAAWQIANPFIGKLPDYEGISPLSIDLGTALDLTVDVRGSAVANEVLELSTATGSIMVIREDWAAVQERLLWQTIEMHPDVNSTPVVQVTLDALANSDLALSAYGQVRLEVTLPADDPRCSITDWNPGDSVLIMNNGASGYSSPADPYLPQNYAWWWRIVDSEIRVPSHGVATQRLTFNITPTLYPGPSGL